MLGASEAGFYHSLNITDVAVPGDALKQATQENLLPRQDLSWDESCIAHRLRDTDDKSEHEEPGLRTVTQRLRPGPRLGTEGFCFKHKWDPILFMFLKNPSLVFHKKRGEALGV